MNAFRARKTPRLNSSTMNGPVGVRFWVIRLGLAVIVAVIVAIIALITNLAKRD